MIASGRNVQSVHTLADDLEEQLAAEGLAAMEAWMKELGLAMSLSELGATEASLEDIAKGVLIMDGGYKVLTKEEIMQVLRESL